MQLDFTRAGLSADNGLREVFGGRLRDVYLNEQEPGLIDHGMRLGI